VPSTTKPATRRPWHRLLLLVPFVWCIAAIPWANTIAYAFGHVPFLLVWMAVGVVVGGAAIAVVYVIDQRNGDADRV
jgi:hypothetical protein